MAATLETSFSNSFPWLYVFFFIKTLRLRHYNRHFTDMLKYFFLIEIVAFLFKCRQRLLLFVQFVQIMAWRRTDDKALNEPMMNWFIDRYMHRWNLVRAIRISDWLISVDTSQRTLTHLFPSIYNANGCKLTNRVALAAASGMMDDSGNHQLALQRSAHRQPWTTIDGNRHTCISGLISGLRPANERRRYFVTTSLIGWAQI